MLRTSGFVDDVMSAHDGDEQATRKMAYTQSHSPDGRTDCSVTFVKTPDNCLPSRLLCCALPVGSKLAV